MAALTGDRNTPMKQAGRVISAKVAASTLIYKGALVASNVTGYAVPATDTASEVVLGVAIEQVDNSAGADGDLEIEVMKGVAGFAGGGTPPTQAEIGRDVMVEFDSELQTAAAATNDVVAGSLDSIVGSTFYIKLPN